MGNEKWMAIHITLLFLTLGASIFESVNGRYNLVSFEISMVCETVIYLLLSFIMNQVNYPQKLVWAHLKLVTDNADDIMPYLSGSLDESERN